MSRSSVRSSSGVSPREAAVPLVAVPPADAAPALTGASSGPHLAPRLARRLAPHLAPHLVRHLAATGSGTTASRSLSISPSLVTPSASASKLRSSR